MSIDLLKRLGLFIVLCVVQIMVLNHIHLFDIAIPLLYIYFGITFHRNYPKWAILLWCFALGLAIDVFSNTPGLAAGSMTLIGVIQPYLLELFVPRDSVEDMNVSIKSMGFVKFTTFSAILIFIFCLAFFALEAFTFYNWVNWLIYACCSAVLTLILILAIESVRTR
jgi:rod shape-determining protein MreD